MILDFQQGLDVIDLTAALSFARRSGDVDRQFAFIGNDAFTAAPDQPGPPQIRYEVRSDFTILQMDAGGPSTFASDGTVDAEIALVGVFALESRDLMF